MLWNRNDLLRFRFLLWKGVVPVPDPVPAPAPVPVPVPDSDIFSTVFQQQKNCTKPCLFTSISSIFS
jgi:hypothetical protein